MSLLKAIPDVYISVRGIPCARHRKYRHLVGNQLVLIVSVPTARLSCFIIQVAKIFLANVVAVSDLRNSQHFAKPASHFDAGLVRHDVSKLVGHDPRQFIVTLRQSDNLARNVHSASPNAERVHTGNLNQKELKPEPIWRQVVDELVADLLQVAVQGTRNALGHQVAEIGFLFV